MEENRKNLARSKKEKKNDDTMRLLVCRFVLLSDVSNIDRSPHRPDPWQSDVAEWCGQARVAFLARPNLADLGLELIKSP